MTKMNSIGEQLLDLFSCARQESFIVAPFIKSAVIARVVEALDPEVKLTCITRWHPHEIKAGVSDIGIWDVLLSHSPAKLLIVPNLHAKYYRADNKLAVGSANLTNAALGWSAVPNIEVMVWRESDRALRQWEANLEAQATTVDDSIVRHFERLVEGLPDTIGLVSDSYSGDENAVDSPLQVSGLSHGSWLPITRYPELLYKVYSRSLENISLGAIESATSDLLILAVPVGLDEATFNASVAANLVQIPLVREVDRFLTQPRSFGAVRDFLGSLGAYPAGRDSSSDWQTLMRWFNFFLPWRFRVSVPNHSEVTIRLG